MESIEKKGRDGHEFRYQKKKNFLNIRNFFFTVRVVKHWDRLLRQVVEFELLEILNTQLGIALSSLV